MRQDALLGDYRPGSTWLHRLTPGPKLFALAVIAVVLVALREPALALSALAVATMLVLWSGMGIATAVRTLRRIASIALLLGAGQVWQQSWARAVDTVGDLAGQGPIALVVTTTI